MRKPFPLFSLRGRRAAPAPSPRFANILILEDEPAVRDVLSEALGRAGYGVLCAGSFEEGLAILEAVGWRNIDAVLTDTHLSREASIRNGHAFHAAWRERHPVPPFIFMDGWSPSGRPNVPPEESCQVYGLAKPFNLTVLLTLLCGILGAAKNRFLATCLHASLLAMLTVSGWCEEVSFGKATRVFPNALPGKAVTVEKVFDTHTRRLSLRSDHESVKAGSSLFALEQAEAGLARAKHGVLQRSLLDKLRTLGDRDEVQVVLSLKHPPGITYLNKFDHPMEDLKAQSLALSNLQPKTGMGTILRRYRGVQTHQDGDFAAVISASKGELLRMAFDEDIGTLSEYEAPKTTAGFWTAAALFGQSSVDLRVLARSAYSHSQSPLPTNLAQGVRAATFESGLNTGFLSCLGVTPVVWDAMPVPFTSPGGDPSKRITDSIHSLVTFTNLVNAAPGARYYHRRSWDYWVSASRNFISNHQLASISMSTNSGYTIPLGDNNLVVDDYAYVYPYPVFSNPTANGGWHLPPNWAAYNALSVGNVQDSALVHFKIDTITCGGGATQTRNPEPRYGYCIDGGTFPNCAGDREMPYLVVPGYTPYGNHTHPVCGITGYVGMTSSCISQGQNWGTSMSAPTLNGMVASLMGTNSYLKFRPELVRAILLNTSRNVHGGLWDKAKDGKDGAGVVHGQNAIGFATNLLEVHPGNAAATKAYNYSQFCESDFSDGLPRTFNIKIPNPKPSGQHLRVVFTWDGFPDLTQKANELPDIDIFMNTNTGYRYSSSFDSNIEILDISANDVTAGGTYSVTINPLTWRRTADARGTCTYSALTWTFVTTNAR